MKLGESEKAALEELIHEAVKNNGGLSEVHLHFHIQTLNVGSDIARYISLLFMRRRRSEDPSKLDQTNS
jgi:hypothetical protein